MNTENNKLIAEFMGLRPKMESPDVYSYSDMPFFSVRENNPEKVMDAIVKYVKYDKDWNWLIEVVEKIEKNYIVDICGKAVSIHENNGEMIVDLCGKNYSNKTEAVYNACIEFIKWHNQQK